MQALRSYCVTASPSVHRIPLGDSRRFSALPRRSPLLLGRFAMTCTAASLSHADECAASVLAFASMVHANFSASHILPTKALLSALRRRQPISSSRSSGRFAPIFRPAASFTAFTGAVRNDLARPRHSAMLANALLLFSPSPAYHRCRLRLDVNFSVSHILPAKALLSASRRRHAHQLIAFFGAVRASILPPHLPTARNRA